MNDKTVAFMKKKKREVVTVIETILPDFEIFEDSVPPEESKKYEDGLPHRFVVYRFLGFGTDNEENAKNIKQTFFVDIYTENEEDTDALALKVLLHISKIKAVRFKNSNKIVARHASSDRMIDIHSLEFVEMIPYGCQV